MASFFWAELLLRPRVVGRGGGGSGLESEIERSMAELYAPPVRAPQGGPRSHVGCGWCCAVCGGYVRVPGVRGAYVDSTGQT